MSDLISREKLRDDIAGLLERNSKLIDEWLANLIDDVIDEQPTVDVEPVRRGHWIDASSGYAFNFFCSECGFIVHEQFISDYKYCPSCGAKMG